MCVNLKVMLCEVLNRGKHVVITRISKITHFSSQNYYLFWQLEAEKSLWKQQWVLFPFFSSVDSNTHSLS